MAFVLTSGIMYYLGVLPATTAVHLCQDPVPVSPDLASASLDLAPAKTFVEVEERQPAESTGGGEVRRGGNASSPTSASSDAVRRRRFFPKSG